jgi:SAM-dependent methyltransferase
LGFRPKSPAAGDADKVQPVELPPPPEAKPSNPFQFRDSVRVAFAAGLLKGKGIEIGAGAYPHELPAAATARYYDLRTDEQAEALFEAEVVSAKPVGQAQRDFPDGADFLIAHNVLEHCPNPIGVLLEWNRLVREGGTVVISFPYYRACHDELRRVPPVQHLIDDHLGAADGDDFPSREHVTSFALGWWKSLCQDHGLETMAALAQKGLSVAHADGPDAHWHAFTTPLSLEVVALAAEFDGLDIQNLRCWSPETGQTPGDILISYTVGPRHALSEPVRELLDSARARSALVRQLSDQAASVATKVRAGRPIVARLARPFDKEGEHGFRTVLPPEFLSQLKEGMTLRLREGPDVSIPEETTVLGPGQAQHEEIRRQGNGAYSFWNHEIYFSSSDGTDCNTNGRSYFVWAEP